MIIQCINITIEYYTDEQSSYAIAWEWNYMHMYAYAYMQFHIYAYMYTCMELHCMHDNSERKKEPEWAILEKSVWNHIATLTGVSLAGQNSKFPSKQTTAHETTE